LGDLDLIYVIINGSVRKKYSARIGAVLFKKLYFIIY